MSQPHTPTARAHRRRPTGPCRAAGLLLWAALSACGPTTETGTTAAGDDTTLKTDTTGPGYRIGGTLTGLAAGGQLTLANGTDTLTVSADGAFEFAGHVAAGGDYAVTLGTLPVGEACTLTRASGSGVQADVSDVVVTCAAATFQVGGHVTGLASGQTLVLQDATAGSVTIAADGAWSLPGRLSFNGRYAVSVATGPVGQTCTVSNFGGTGVVADVGNVDVVCAANAHTIGGTVSGLANGGSVTLTDNGGDALTLSADGPFTFATPVADGGSYLVAVATQPAGQTCSVTAGSGSGVTGPVASVAVVCAANGFTVGGTVAGLPGGEQLTLTNNGGDALVVSTGGAFTFATPVAQNASASVQVGSQPSSAQCRVTNGTRAGLSAAVTDVQVDCRRSVLFASLTVSSQPKIVGYHVRSDGSSVIVSTRDTTAAATHLVYSPMVDRLYTVDGTTGSVLSYTVDSDGVLVYAGVVAIGTAFTHLSIDSTGRYLLAVDGTGKQVQVIDTTSSTSIAAVGTSTLTPMLATFTAGLNHVAVFHSDRSLARYPLGGDPTQLTSATPSLIATSVPTAIRYAITAHPSDPAVFIARSAGANSGITGYDLSGVSPVEAVSLALTGTLSGLEVDETGQNLLFTRANQLGTSPMIGTGAFGSPVYTSLATAPQTNLILEPSRAYGYFASATTLQRLDRATGLQVTVATGVAQPRSLTLRRW